MLEVEIKWQLVKSYRGVYDSLYEPLKDYDGAFLPFDLPHNDLAVNSYKAGREEGDELKKDIVSKDLGEGTRRESRTQ